MTLSSQGAVTRTKSTRLASAPKESAKKGTVRGALPSCRHRRALFASAHTLPHTLSLNENAAPTTNH